MPKKKVSLPNKLIVIKNADKDFQETWNSRRNLLNIPHSYRLLCIGPPGVGKSSVVKNLILRAHPPFEEIYIIHCDPENTKEYDDLKSSPNVSISGEVPDPDKWNSDKKKLCIVDDLELTTLSKLQSRNLDRLFGYVSSHRSLSVTLCSQDSFSIPPLIRRCANVWVLWKMSDLDSLGIVARKSGINKDSFKLLFNKCESIHDSIWIDKTENSPAPLRFNGYEILDYKYFTK